jgi:hypothetical protein
MINSFKYIRLSLARLFLQNYPFSRGLNFFTNLLLYGISKLPDKASFSFKYGFFIDVSINKWPLGYWDLFLYGIQDKNEVTIWKKFLSKGDVVIDVGANFGYWTLVASKLVGNSGKIFSFEPVNSIYEKLNKNVIKSKANNVFSYRKGLSNINKKEVFNIASSDDSGTRSSQGKQIFLQYLHFILVYS